MSEKVFATKRQHSQHKRASNREASALVLHDNGVAFTVHNQGAHLVIRNYNLTIDFWPGTGLWIVQGNPRQHRGVFNLLKFLGNHK